MIRRTLFLLLSTLIFTPALYAEEAQKATALRDTVLRTEPFSDAAVVTRVSAKQSLTVLKRKGGWYQARDSRNHTGWLRMSTIRFGEGRAASSDTSDSGIGQTLRFLSTGRSGASGTTVATGIRGLDSADVADATPDHNAIKRLDKFRVSASDARRYALNAKLRSQKLGYLKEPE